MIEMADPLALQIQRLGGFKEQVLVLLHAAELRSGGQAATPAAVAALFRALHLRPPKNERQHLLQLREKGFIMQPRPGRWAATPEGEEEIRRLMVGVDLADLERISQDAGEPVFAGAAHHRIPASMAPALFQRGIAQFVQDNPGERNVFLMVRFPKEGDAYSMQPTIDMCRKTLGALGMRVHLASDRAVDDKLFENVGVHMWSCDFGVAILEEREKALNYSVVLETGAMLMTGRRCLLLKDKLVKTLPVDLIAHIHKEVDLDRPKTVEAAVRHWVSADLAFA